MAYFNRFVDGLVAVVRWIDPQHDQEFVKLVVAAVKADGERK